MKLSDRAAEQTRADWRELGFFYDRDDEVKEWRLTGSRKGLLAFPRLLEDYAANPQNAKLLEHDHFGPHMYLKVMTTDEANLDKNAISGTLEDLHRLSGMARELLRSAPTGPLVIKREYASSAEYSLILDLRDDGFDPASMDPQL